MLPDDVLPTDDRRGHARNARLGAQGIDIVAEVAIDQQIGVQRRAGNEQKNRTGKAGN